MNEALYTRTALETSRVFTQRYSTSFYSAARLLAPDIREAIFGIYGFVRLADEIVDTFAGRPQARLLDRLEGEYYSARSEGLSLNPVVHAFVSVVRQYGIEDQLVESFLDSMRADLTKSVYRTEEEMAAYVYGSADVVGLMCLHVFTGGDDRLYHRLEMPARKLGSAFQKVNFLRDLKDDTQTLARYYFPALVHAPLSERIKLSIIAGIEQEFEEAYEGIRQLPSSSRLGVYMAYVYYSKLLKKIKKTPAARLTGRRVRVSDFNKLLLFTRSVLLDKARLL